MIVERIWTANNYRNFTYLLACPETGEALAIDPLDHVKTLALAKAKGWNITQILNTHEHHDHTGGNEAVVAATGAKVIAHAKAGGSIQGMDRGVVAGDVIKVGKTVELECLDTPGHTMCHICLRSHTEQPALFSGDTLFNAGAGNVHNGGDVHALYSSFVESDNAAASALLGKVTNHDPASSVVTTLKEEKQHNTFFRLTSPSVIAKLRESFPELGEAPDAKTVFMKLRELRNTW
jgi:hydroxyacylglutathione hydrolase